MNEAETKPTIGFERSPELAEQICSMIAEGFSLRYSCSELGLAPSSVLKWFMNDEAIHKQYVRARENQAEVRADELIELADSATPETANAIRLQVDTRKWVAAKLLPKKYGDQPALVQVNNSLTIVVPEPKRAELIERRRNLTPQIQA